MAVDALGRPLKLILTPGQRGDAPLAPALLTGLSPRRVLADKAYDSNAIRALVAEGHWSQKGTGRRPRRRGGDPLQSDPKAAHRL